MALDRLTKVDGGGISTTSDYRVGIITASKFVGPIEGDVTGSITATDGTFSGNVTIGGTLTYEDVTNIDSVGIITARDGIHVGAGVSAVGVGTFSGLDISGDIDVDGHTNLDNVSIAGVSTFTGEIDHNSTLTTVKLKVNSTNAQIDLTSGQNSFTRYGAINHYHNNSTSTIHNQIKLAPRNGGTGRIMFYNLGGGSLTEKFRIDGTDGVQTLNDTNLSVAGDTTLTGDLDVDGHTNLDNVSIAGITTFSGIIDAVNTPASIRVAQDIQHKGDADTKITFPANDNISFETAGDQHLRIASDGNVGIGTNNNTPTSKLHILVDGVGQGIHIANKENLYPAGSTGYSDIRFSFRDYLSGGSSSAPAIIRAQSHNAGATSRSSKLIFFTSSSDGTNTPTEKMRIEHDGDVGIGTVNPAFKLDLRTTGQADLLIGSYNAGGARLMLDGDSNGDGSGGDFCEIMADTSGDLTINARNPASDAEMIFKTGGGTNRWKIDSSGHFLPGAVGSYNIGSASAEIGDVYIADDKRFYAGSDQNISLFHTSSNGINHLVGHPGNMFYHSGTHYFTNSATSQVYAQFVQNSYCELRHSGNLKFRTSETGIDVTGEVAASQNYPNIRPLLDFNFAATKKLDTRLDYTRKGVASFVNEFGKVVLVGDNVPRFDHDPITRECKGLLIEEERTNYQPYSVDMSQGANNNGVTVTNNQSIAPDGTLSASKITGGTDQNTSQRLGWSTQGVNSSTHTQWSIWVKSEETSCILQIYSNTYTIGADYMNIELADGSTQGSTIDANFRFSIEEYPNKWWRISWGGVGNAGGNSGGMYLAVVPTMNSGRAANTGSAHSKVWFAWGLQEEVASSAKYSTSYIPTYGSTATRGYEAPILQGTEFSDVFGTQFNEFSLVADYDNDFGVGASGQNYALIDMWGESTGYNDRIQFFRDDASPYHIETRAFGQGNALFNNGNVTASTLAKTQRFATSWYVPDYSNTSSRRFVISMGGEAVDVIADNTGTTVPQLTRMGIGCSPTRLDFPPGLLHFKRLMVYNKTLSDGQLQNLSAQ